MLNAHVQPYMPLLRLRMGGILAGGAGCIYMAHCRYAFLLQSTRTDQCRLWVYCGMRWVVVVALYGCHGSSTGDP